MKRKVLIMALSLVMGLGSAMSVSAMEAAEGTSAVEVRNAKCSCGGTMYTYTKTGDLTTLWEDCNQSGHIPGRCQIKLTVVPLYQVTECSSCHNITEPELTGTNIISSEHINF